MASGQETEDTRVNKKPRLHETHCDPCGDVTLISNDVVEFRASSFQLSKISQFFADAFSLPAPADKEREPIHLDFRGDVIEIYLDLVTAPVRFQGLVLPGRNFDVLDVLIPLATLVEFTLSTDHITSLVHEALKRASMYSPMKVLP